MSVPKRRRDYASNARKRPAKQSGCTWCGADTDHVSMYCSDACLQADMEGIEDRPPVTVLAFNAAGCSDEYLARKWS
jgi:hypothetical protein